MNSTLHPQPSQGRFQRLGMPALLGGVAGLLSAFLLLWQQQLLEWIRNTPVSNAPVVVQPRHPVVILSNHFEPDANNTSFEVEFDFSGSTVKVGDTDDPDQAKEVTAGDPVTVKLDGTNLRLEQRRAVLVDKIKTVASPASKNVVLHPVASGNNLAGSWRQSNIEFDMFGRKGSVQLFRKKAP